MSLFRHGFYYWRVQVAVNRLTYIDEYENLAPDLFSEVESLSNGKRTLERAVFELSSSQTSSAVARIFTCYGPHIPTELHYAMGNFIGRRRGQPIVVNFRD